MRKQITVSDFSGDTVDETEVVQITLRFADRRRGVYVAEASPGDEIVRLIVSSGRKQAARGRRPQAAAEAPLDELLVERAGKSRPAKVRA